MLVLCLNGLSICNVPTGYRGYHIMQSLFLSSTHDYFGFYSGKFRTSLIWFQYELLMSNRVLNFDFGCKNCIFYKFLTTKWFANFHYTYNRLY